MPEDLFGGPYLCMHRADLIDALARAVPTECIHFNRKLVGLDMSTDGVRLAFHDGSHALGKRPGTLVVMGGLEPPTCGL